MEEDLFSDMYGSEIKEGLEKIKKEYEEKLETKIEIIKKARKELGQADAKKKVYEQLKLDHVGKYGREYKKADDDCEKLCIGFEDKQEEYKKEISLLNDKIAAADKAIDVCIKEKSSKKELK